MPQYVYLKLGYDVDKTTKEDAIAMLSEHGGFYSELLSLEEVKEETKESFCCSRMAQAVKGKIFKPIHCDTDLTKIEYYSFNFQVDSNLSVSSIIHYCPFCGKKIGVKETKREEDNEKIKCPKCGSEMRCYQVQTQSRVGYRFDIELQAFQCTNPRCTYTKNIKKEVLPTNALYIKEGDGSFTKIR